MLFSVFTAVRLLRSEALGNLAALDILALVAAYVLGAMEVLIPSAFFAGLVMSMSVWHRDGEAQAVYSSGTHPNRVKRPLWILAIGVCLIVAIFSITVRPYSYNLRYEVKSLADSVQSSSMRSKYFYDWDLGFVIQAQKVQNRQPNLQDVFAHVTRPTHQVLLRAASGQIDPPDDKDIQRITFEDGVSYHIYPNDQRIIEFKSLEYRAQRAPSDRTVRRRGLSTGTLRTIDDHKHVAEYQWRFALPIAAFLLVLVGIEVNRLQPRQSPYPRYMWALVAYVATFMAMNVTTSAVENGTLPTTPGVFLGLLIPLSLFVVARLRFGSG